MEWTVSEFNSPPCSASIFVQLLILEEEYVEMCIMNSRLLLQCWFGVPLFEINFNLLHYIHCVPTFVLLHNITITTLIILSCLHSCLIFTPKMVSKLFGVQIKLMWHVMLLITLVYSGESWDRIRVFALTTWLPCQMKVIYDNKQHHFVVHWAFCKHWINKIKIVCSLPTFFYFKWLI